MARGIQRMIKGTFATGQGAGNSVLDRLPQRVVFKKPARIGFGHHCSPSFMSGWYGVSMAFCDGLSAAHHTAFCIKGVGRIAMQLPPCVDSASDTL